MGRMIKRTRSHCDKSRIFPQKWVLEEPLEWYESKGTEQNPLVTPEVTVWHWARSSLPLLQRDH